MEKALKDRTKYMQKAMSAGNVIDDYANKIGLNENHPDFEDACLYSDVRIYCEVGCSEEITRKALMKVLSEKRRQ